MTETVFSRGLHDEADVALPASKQEPVLARLSVRSPCECLDKSNSFSGKLPEPGTDLRITTTQRSKTN